MNIERLDANNFELQQIESVRPFEPIANERIQNKTLIITKSIFQRVLILSLIRLVIYLNKLYQDYNAVSTYYRNNDLYFLIISVISLIAPPIVYALYLIGDNLIKEEEINKIDVSTKTINGLLLIPWQIKRYLDVLYFVFQRICLYRSIGMNEREELTSLQRNAEVLEFFEDFYSGFLQIVLQLYLLMASFEDNSQHKTLYGELIGSALCILSMMIAVRRRDDGILTSFLSSIGWLSLFISRVVVFSFITTIIGFYIFILCLIHAFSISIWIYSIAIESYYIHSSIHFWTKRKRILIAMMVFLFFGLPSLLIWPIMFQLKENRRPLIFLLIIAIENMGLLGVWFAKELIKDQSLKELHLSNREVILVIAIVCFTIIAVLFLTIYTFCKPKHTYRIFLHEMKVTDTESYGIYYEFFDLAFKLQHIQNVNMNFVHHTNYLID